MHRRVKISAVIPCHDEENGIAYVLSRMPDFIDEVVVVANSCTDRTEEVARAMGAKVVVEPRKGYGRAYKSGIAAASHDIVVTMDGDGTYPTIAIGYLVDVLCEDDLDFVSAWRLPIDWKKGPELIQRFFGNKVLTWTLWLLYLRVIRDSQSGMWVFRKSVVEHLDVTSDGMAFSEELKIEAFTHPEVKAREVAIQFKYVERIGASKLHLWRDGVRNLVFLAQKRMTLGRGRKRIPGRPTSEMLAKLPQVDEPVHSSALGH
ncbi:MAG: glycosyltransferase family 2 protein [Acidobacteriota bacterium]